MERVIVVEPDPAALEEALQLFVGKRMPAWRRGAQVLNGVLLILAQAAAGGFAGTALAAATGGPVGRAAFLAGAAAAVVLLSLLPALGQRRLLRSFVSNRAADARRTWTLSPEGAQVDWRDGTARIAWPGVEEVIRGARGLSLVWAGSIWVLPRGAFASEAEMAAVEADLAAWRAAASAR